MHLPAKQRVYASLAGCAALFGVSYVGMRQVRPDAPLSVAPISGTVPPVGSALPSDEGKPIQTSRPTEGEEPTPAPKELVVALAGAVKTPGLLHLPPDARVDDAIKRAGGAKADADLESINLAARAVDGDQIYVPHKKAAEPEKAAEAQKVASKYRGGEVSPRYAPLAPPMPATLSGSLEGGSAGGGSLALRPAGVTKKKASGPVSLSTGSLAELETLPGVGPATAQKILDYRMEHGGFASVDEIQAVKGIGPKKFEKMRPFLKR